MYYTLLVPLTRIADEKEASTKAVDRGAQAKVLQQQQQQQQRLKAQHPYFESTKPLSDIKHHLALTVDMSWQSCKQADSNTSKWQGRYAVICSVCYAQMPVEEWLLTNFYVNAPCSSAQTRMQGWS